MAVKTYSLKKDGSLKLSAHFQVREFAAAGTDEVKIDTDLITLLEKLFAHMNLSKLIITSGYRPVSNGDYHQKGMAADMNCFRKENGKEIRLQGPPILCALQDIGARGIGWISGSAASRAAVHVDTRTSPAWFDEADYSKKIRPDTNGWYGYDMGAYFNAMKPKQPIEPPVNPDPPAPEKPKTVIYKVVKGDNLSRIAAKLSKQYGVTLSWSKIAKDNNIANPNLILIGQTLTIHLS